MKAADGSLSSGGYKTNLEIVDIKGGIENQGEVSVNEKEKSGNLLVDAGVTEFTVIVDVTANKNLTGKETLYFQLEGLEGTDKSKTEPVEASLNQDLCSPENMQLVPGEEDVKCFTLSDDGYLGYIEGPPGTEIENWYVYDELGIDSIRVRIVGDAKEFPAGWLDRASTGTTGNGVPAVLEIEYIDGEGPASDLEIRGYLDAQAKDGNELVYPYFYLWEVLDTTTNEVIHKSEDLSGIDLSDSSDASYPLAVFIDKSEQLQTENKGSSMIMMHLAVFGDQFLPGSTELGNNVKLPAASSVPVEDRDQKKNKAGGGVKPYPTICYPPSLFFLLSLPFWCSLA